jgi:hypothetical protein
MVIRPCSSSVLASQDEIPRSVLEPTLTPWFALRFLALELFYLMHFCSKSTDFGDQFNVRA